MKRKRIVDDASRRQVDEEIRLHAEMEAERLERAGMEASAAELEAARRLGLSGPERESLYAAAARRNRRLARADRIRGWLEDVRQSVRTLSREPKFSVFVVLALALGIGANGAMFGVADRILLRGPDQVAEPAALVRLYLRFDGDAGGGRRTAPWIPYAAFEHVRESVGAFEGVTAYAVREEAVALGARTRPLRVSTTEAGYFGLLGVRPHAGRFFGGSATDGDAGVVISHDVWLTDFGGRSDAVGASLDLQGSVHTIIGVAPPRFTGPDLERVDAWVPMDRRSVTTRNWRVIARRRDGASFERASVEAANALSLAPANVPSWARAATMVAGPLGFDDSGRKPAEASIAGLLLSVVAFVLVIAMANVINLLLARVTRKRSQVAVRLALGASRWRLARMMLTESLILAFIAGAVSLPVAWITGDFVRRVLLPQVEWTTAPLNARVLLVLFAVVLVTGIGIGLLPGWIAARTVVAGRLGSAAREGRSRTRARLHIGLTVAQTALSAALLIGAGVFLRSYWRIHSTDLGVDPDRVLRVEMRYTDSRAYRNGSAEEQRIYAEALRRVGETGIATHAALAIGLPFTSNFTESVYLPGADSIPELPGGGPWVNAVSAGYFGAVGTRILDGRAFSDVEVAAGENVVVVSESMARQAWPGRSPIGECFHIGDRRAPCSRVLGVAEDVHRTGYREPPSMQYYIPIGRQAGFSGTVLVARLRVADGASVQALRDIVEHIEAGPGYADIRPLAAFLEPQIRPWRLGAAVLSLCAALALLVAVTGVFGVLSFLVAERRREIGIRMALGATRAGIRRLIVRTGTVPAAAGLFLGAAATMLAARRVEPMLFETSLADPFVLAAVFIVLMGAAVIACIVPAANAARVDPAGSLAAD